MVVDALVSRLLQRPRGVIARRMWRDMRSHHEIFQDVLNALALGPDDRLVEVGCGGGTFMRWALRSGCTAAAVDHSSDMMRLTQRQNSAAVAEGRLQVRQTSSERLPFDDGEFTCAAMMNVFFFLNDPHLTLVELRRVLSSDGRLVIHTVAPDPPTSVVPSRLARRMRLYPDAQLGDVLSGAGWVDVKVDRLGKQAEFQLVTARRGSA